MENVMNFLADNYIWFFVAAGVLFFALIGFIIESKKKTKSEFKGESIDNSVIESNLTPLEDSNSNVEVINSNVNLSNTENNNILEPVVNTTLGENNSIEEIKPREVLNSSVEVPINVPTPEPMPEVSETIVETPVINNTFSTITPEEITPIKPISTIGETISYEQATNNDNIESVNLMNTQPSDNHLEDTKENNNYNTFDNMN